MNKVIHLSRTKDETASELEWILSHFVLAMSRSLRSLASQAIHFPEQMEQVPLFQLQSSVRLPLFIDQQRKFDTGFIPERSRIVGVSESDRSQSCPFAGEFILMLAQLRDVLAAEDSTVMAKEYHYGWALSPQRTEFELPAIDIG